MTGGPDWEEVDELGGDVGRPRLPEAAKLKTHGFRCLEIEWMLIVEAAGGEGKVGRFMRELMREKVGLPPLEKKISENPPE